MPTVSEQLREAREAQKLTIHQAAELTKIKTDHIRALEAGDFHAFSAPVYIRGFARTYARYLKLDEAIVLSGLDAELGQYRRVEEPPADFEPRSRESLTLLLSRVNWRVWGGVALVAVVLAGSVTAVWQWRTSQNRDPLRSLGPGMYQPAQKSQGELLPIPPAR